MVNIEADLYTFIEDSIRHWVGKNFGSSELNEPSWNIDALAFHLTKALTKRDMAIRNMSQFDLTFYLKEMEDEKRAEIMSRVKEKIDRVGGSVSSIVSSNEEFTSPISGEKKGIKVVIEADIPTNRYAIRGLNRWFERQQEGHGTILSFMLETKNGMFV